MELKRITDYATRYKLFTAVLLMSSIIALTHCASHRPPEPLFDQTRLEEVISRYMNTPYSGRRQSKEGLDCSGFVQQVFADLGCQISRTVKEQYQIGKKVKDIDELIVGDLIFFDYKLLKKVSHVGIYMGNYRFAHASPSRGVVIDSLKAKHFRKKFVGGRRMEKCP